MPVSEAIWHVKKVQDALEADKKAQEEAAANAANANRGAVR
jgi:hypothetical protein